MDLLNHTCPNCGGSIQFEPALQRIKCHYCRSVFEVETFHPKDAILGQEPKPASSDWNYTGSQWLQREQDGMGVYSCRSCGADIIAEATQGTATCLFCRKPVVITTQFSGTLRPDMIIPFKLRKEEAIEALEKHYLGKWLLPKVFRNKNHINEIKGVYVPFWLFSAQAEAYITYKTTKVRRWSDAQYHYKETSHYLVSRAGHLLFSHVPVDASSAMDDALMDTIEPFNLDDSAEFQSVYLTGYYANKYDVDMNTCFSRADNRITESILSAFSQTVKGYNSVSLNSQNTNLKNRNAKYALFPIWLLTTVWKDKEYIFAMNGQTGKLAGDLPLDKKAKHLWFWSILLGLGAVSTVLAGLSNYIVIATADDPLFDTVNQTLTTNDLIVWAVISLIGGSVIAYFVTGRMQRKLKTARMKKHASDYIQPGSFLISFSNEKFLGKNVSTSSKKSR